MRASHASAKTREMNTCKPAIASGCSKLRVAVALSLLSLLCLSSHLNVSAYLVC